MPGDDPCGIVVTIIIGIVGAVIGGWLEFPWAGRRCYGSVDMVNHFGDHWGCGYCCLSIVRLQVGGSKPV